ncbi:M3 family metallopeptidase [Peredibacter starrii]|uniref:M3 family metallopeptidase n=1 Tax=Peredibacter starrii TaxID=28202 RepID=A0AAX4HRN2_9BACT|nr:M3 family metallopeptidase [Peredibacter starrii]WPU65954.1 M3 family metallopeptidase [Peredibacter starrii]
MQNPLLETPKARHGAYPFDKILPEHFLPALNAAIETAKGKLETFKNDKRTDFQHVVVEKGDITEQVDYIAGIFFNLHSAECSDELEKISPEVSEILTRFGNDISLDPKIFMKVKACYDTRMNQGLNPEEMTIIEKTYKSFVRNGALLAESEKDQMRVMDEKLAKLTLTFSQNVLKATNDYLMEITNKADLDGLPEGVIEAAAELAEKKGKTGSWCFDLNVPSMLPFMTYSKKRDLRKTLLTASSSKTFNTKYDNQETLKEILKLRTERAQLLGFKTHADYVLEERMAMSPKKVMDFLEELLSKAKPHAEKDVARLKKLAAEDGINDLQSYDTAYYSEILKKRELDMDDEMLRPYFKLENVVDGIFEVAKRLYGLTFKEVFDVPKYHTDVRTFEVFDEATNAFVGLFYTDFFPRPTKRGGAWMSGIKEQGMYQGKVERPHIMIVCNFTKPTKTKPSLLTLDEVLTLYHEFGHALHGLLSKVKYRDLSGTNVYWDFVELPSQIMENWVLEKECLDIFAVHYETGEKIPADLVQKIKASGKFLEGMGTLRQLTFAFLDMAYHTADPNSIKDIGEFETKTVDRTTLLPKIPGTSISTSFSHIFAGGYSAGYYSYKWAEVLDADAFEFFQTSGIFNREVANKFREFILEKGGTEHPMELYKKFRGQEPDVGALLRRAGLH